MGAAQRNAAEIYLAGMRRSNGGNSARGSRLAMNSMPAEGFIRTGSLSGVTDSAAAGTALSCGRKTVNGAIAMGANGESYKSIASIARENGMKVGIITSSFLQDATPSVFYAHSPKRTSLYTIGLQLAESGFDYFAGGGFRKPKDRPKSEPALADIAKLRGYRVITDNKDFSRLAKGDNGKVIAISPRAVSSGYMPWAIDAKGGDITLADFVKKGIELLECDEGFFIMAEGGKIDLACHANDAAAAVREVMDMDAAVSAALDFMRAHPDDTLIVVTADHETGGMTLASSEMDAPRFYAAVSRQRGSHAAFERTVSPGSKEGFVSALNRAADFFGCDIPDSSGVRSAYSVSMTARAKRPVKSAEYKTLYATYDPFTVACMKEANARAGVTWTTFYHTGKNVPISAAGAGSDAFAGEYENTEVFTKLRGAMIR
ncbi:alkaline phosphatase [Synergistales bacterium]|nr:alkaline phosphatase [Synergistales bacterium]